MKLTERQQFLLDFIVDESLDIVLLENAYQDYFRELCKKHGVKSPFQIKDLNQRKKFFNELKAGWAKHPKNKKNM